MSGREIDLDSLRTAGAALQDVSGRFFDELQALVADLSAFGSPWGGDEIGSLIGAACEEVTSYAIECFSEAIEELGIVGVDLSQMAHLYEQNEIRLADQFTELNRGLE
mgnify:CR=1 FL=1